MTTTIKAPAKAETITVPQTLPGSWLAAIHRATGPLREALLAQPAWVDAVRAVAHLDGLRPPQRDLITTDNELRGLILEAVEARRPLDAAGLLEHARKAHVELAAQQALNDAFGHAADALGRQLDAAAQDATEALCHHLSSQLVDLVEEARRHAHLLDVDAETAISNGQAEPWQRIQELRAKCRQLRAAHGQLERQLEWSTTVELPELRWVANVDEVFKDWRAWRHGGHLEDSRDPHERKPIASPFPDFSLRGAAESDAWLNFLVRTAEAEPWLPSPRQYAAAVAALTTAPTDSATDKPRRGKAHRRPEWLTF